MGTEFATLATLATSLLIGLTRAYTVSGFGVANVANVANLAGKPPDFPVVTTRVRGCGAPAVGCDPLLGCILKCHCT